MRQDDHVKIRLPPQRPIVPPSERKFAFLYALTNFPRLMLLTYLPIVSIQLLRDTQTVGLLYLFASSGAVAATAAMPALLRWVSDRQAYIILSSLGLVSFVLLASNTYVGLWIGLAFFVTYAAGLEILLSFFALENLTRAVQTRYESLRQTFSILGFTCAPAIGVFTGINGAPSAPFIVAAIFVLIGSGFIYTLETRPRRNNAQPPPSPLRYFKRFFVQPRLRLAYMLALGRSAWWQMFFVYVPIVLLSLGYSATVSGFIGSIAMALTILIPFWAAIAKRIGVRRHLVCSFMFSGASVLSISVLHNQPIAVLAALIIAVFWIGAAEGVGNIFFLRAVHPYERIEMAAVFPTYRDLSQAVPSLVIVPLASVLDLQSIIAGSGLWLLWLGFLSSLLPRRL